MIAACRRHANALLESPQATRHQLSELARAIGRLGVPELTNVVGQLCAEDLRRWRGAREERARSPIAASGNDALTLYTRTYSGALAAIGDDNAVELLKGKLADPLFGQEAALALRQICERQHTTTPAPKARLLSGPDLSQVKIRRAERRAGLPKQCQFGEAIFAVAEDLAKPARSEAEQRQALGLATVAFTMPYANKTGLIELLLALDPPLAEKRNLLMALTMAGEIISVELMLEGIRAFFEAAKQKPWMLQGTGLWELKEWLQLLPFSDRPSATIEALELLPKNLLHRWDLRGVLSSLANTPDTDAERILGELAKRDHDLLGEYDWVDALFARATDSAYLMVFDLFCDPNTAGGKKIEGYVLSNKLAEVISRRPDLRNELLRRYEDPKLAHCHGVIEEVLAKSPHESVVLAMVQSYSKRRKPLDQLLRAAIEGVALERRPVPGWERAYDLYRIPVPDLRKKLFAMSADKGEQANLAGACLTALDELRDEYGYVNYEPRHPGI
jgi:NACHT conflict system protein